MSNYSIKGPDLQVYLNNQKVRLNFQGTTAHEFYTKFSFLNIRNTLAAPTGSDPTYMARVAQCVFEQLWFEAQVATVVEHLANALELHRVNYSWRFVRDSSNNTNWNPEFTLVGLRNEREPEDHDEEVPQYEVRLTHMIPEPVASNTERSMRVWLNYIVHQFFADRAAETLAKNQNFVEKSQTAWQEHLAEHPH